MYIKFESIILSRCAEKRIKFYFAVRVKKISKNILLAVSLKKKKWGSRTPFNQNLNLHNKYMRYIRITRVLNREENYVLNRDVCYYCTGTANISIRLRAVESERRAYSSDCEIQYSGIFFFSTVDEEFSWNRDILGSCAGSFSPSGWSRDQLAFDLTSSFFFVVGIEKKADEDESTRFVSLVLY